MNIPPKTVLVCRSVPVISSAGFLQLSGHIHGTTPRNDFSIHIKPESIGSIYLINSMIEMAVEPHGILMLTSEHPSDVATTTLHNQILSTLGYERGQKRRDQTDINNIVADRLIQKIETLAPSLVSSLVSNLGNRLEQLCYTHFSKPR